MAFRLLMGRYKVTCAPGSHSKEPSARAAWGCDSSSVAPVFPDPITGSYHESKHFDLHRCPACQVGYEWSDLISAWLVFAGEESRGPLPLAGGWLDQMQWFADAHSILARERQKYIEACRATA